MASFLVKLAMNTATKQTKLTKGEDGSSVVNVSIVLPGSKNGTGKKSTTAKKKLSKTNSKKSIEQTMPQINNSFFKNWNKVIQGASSKKG